MCFFKIGVIHFSKYSLTNWHLYGFVAWNSNLLLFKCFTGATEPVKNWVLRSFWSQRIGYAKISIFISWAQKVGAPLRTLCITFRHHCLIRSVLIVYFLYNRNNTFINFFFLKMHIYTAFLLLITNGFFLTRPSLRRPRSCSR